MSEFPNHLCPLCGKPLRILTANLINATSIKVEIECSNTNNECPYSKEYKLSISDIHKNGY